VPEPMGNDHPNLAPYGPVACADTDLVVGAGTDGQFVALCAAIGAAELAGDPRFATNALRVANREELSKALAAVFSTRSARDWQTALDAAGVPCAPVQSIDQVASDPHVEQVGLVSTVGHARGDIRLVGSPVRVNAQRSQIRRAPPLVGEHTEEILAALGLDPQMIDQLRSQGVC
ncbi:MAG TPA: CoA transferase, partial [Egibacteraceae bacterium]|nr:CoA transferase [Egibacteraceae bacterium]